MDEVMYVPACGGVYVSVYERRLVDVGLSLAIVIVYDVCYGSPWMIPFGSA